MIVDQPKRIQRQRTKGWRMPEGAIYVGRPSLFGNPWTPSEAHAQRGFAPNMTARDKAALAVDLYRGELVHWGLMSDWADVVSDERWDAVRKLQDESGARNMAQWAGVVLGGHDLACWCALDFPCHGDALLRIANG